MQRASTLAIFALAALLLVSCASLNSAREGEVRKNDAVAQQISQATGDTSDTADAGPKTDRGEVSQTDKSAAEKTPDAIENLTIGEVIGAEEPNTANLYDNSRYDFPITVNSRVEGWIDYFTGRGRIHMERYLSRSSRYMPMMRQILKKNGLPEDLVYLALIESGFNMRARSRARAVGPWQFVKATGKRYGLRVDSWIDERRDFIASTEAAAKYLKDLYLMFESWYLAASAYNAGEYKILRAVDSVKTHNYWRICQSHAIKRETKDYVPKLIAAAIIGKNPSKYGFDDVSYEDPVAFETVSVDFPLQLKEIATLVDAPEDDILDLNPELAHGVVPPDSNTYEVRVPVGSRVIVERALASMKSGNIPAQIPYQHLVKSGDTLRSVARKYHMRLNELAAANNLSPRERLEPGSSLVIPHRMVATSSNRTPSSASVSAQPAAATSTATAKKSVLTNDQDGFILHTVRRGESLWSISEKYSVTIQDIFKWNNLKKSRIFPGKRLRIRSDKESMAERTAVVVQKKKRHG